MQTHTIIVNYHAAALTLQAVASVRRQAFCGPVSITVVDNSTCPKEADYLQRHLPPEVHLRVSSVNLGFGAACNLAYKESDAPLVLLLNPDARLLPDCLWRLQQTLLSSERCAAVGPRIYWDDAQTWLLPPSCPASVFWLRPLMNRLAAGRGLRRLWRQAWRYYQIRHWTATASMRTGNLSGGHALLKRRAVEKAGGLFDERFFMYFEDTDLFLRLKRAGYHLVMEPRAAVVHHYDHCGSDRAFKQRLMQEAHTRFVEKYKPGWLTHLEQLLTFSTNCQSEMTLVAAGLTGPFHLNIPLSMQKSWLFEWSPNADFIPSAGCFGRGQKLSFTQAQWSMLPPGLYHGRLGLPNLWQTKLFEITWHKF